MSTYAQPSTKRQKVRDARVVDNVDYFQGIPKVEYSDVAPNVSSEVISYRYYNAGERLQSYTCEEWLKLSVSLTEFMDNGTDIHGKPTFHRSWDDQTNTIDNYKRNVKACVDFCCKLGVKYITAFDTDLIPQWETWEEWKGYWDEMVEFLQDVCGRHHVKFLWIAPDLHSHSRYALGALTSNESSTYIHAATQIKKCLEVSQKLNCECFLLWPYREGYDDIFKTDVTKELKLFAKLLKATADYKERLNYRCQLLIMPYQRSFEVIWRGNWREFDDIKRYMWDVTSCLFFLRYHNLERFFKVCASPGHEAFMANAYNMLGGVVIANDRECYDIRKYTLLMKTIVKQDAPLPGGVSLQVPAPRGAGGARARVALLARHADAAARALRLATRIHTEQKIHKLVQQKYSSYSTGAGVRLGSGELSLDECEDLYKKNQTQPNEAPSWSRSELLDTMFQRYLDSSE